MVKEKLLKQFGERLKLLRLDRGMSQEDFAAICKLDRTYISGLERGIRNPSLTCIVRVSAGLRINAEDLIKGIDLEHGD